MEKKIILKDPEDKLYKIGFLNNFPIKGNF